MKKMDQEQKVLKKTASTPACAGEHFGYLENILDQNFCCFVALFMLSQITQKMALIVKKYALKHIQ